MPVPVGQARKLAVAEEQLSSSELFGVAAQYLGVLGLIARGPVGSSAGATKAGKPWRSAYTILVGKDADDADASNTQGVLIVQGD